MAGTVRAVVLVAMMIFLAWVYFIVAGAAVDGVGEEIKSQGDNLDVVDGESTIDSVYDSVFKWVPMTFIFGFIVIGAGFVLFRERFVGRRGGGGF